MKVTVLAQTQFNADACAEVMKGFRSDAEGGQALVEAAGRACYQAFEKKRPSTASNSGYLAHIIEVDHGSVLEHATVTFYIEGVSRALTHELIRHRHLSYSQLSQRFVSGVGEMVMPSVIAHDGPMADEFEAFSDQVQVAYDNLLAMLEAKYAYVKNGTMRRKLARQAARSVLPNATETKIVVTGNYRAWRHFLEVRGSVHADAEIRALAVKILDELFKIAPNVFGDFIVSSDPDTIDMIIEKDSPS